LGGRLLVLLLRGLLVLGLRLGLLRVTRLRLRLRILLVTLRLVRLLRIHFITSSSIA
jgi:hypothetical protein